LPPFLVNELKINENDEVNFLKFKKWFIFGKKEELAKLIEKGIEEEEVGEEVKEKEYFVPTQEELEVLKKLDSIKYEERTPKEMEKRFSKREKEILENLIKKKVVEVRKSKGKEVYSIALSVYNRFLLRKKGIKIGKKGEIVKVETKNQEAKDIISNLEKEGYIVVSTEEEANELSKILENDIRMGNVIGTRGFDKKYYVVISSFFVKESQKIIELLKNGEATLQEICQKLNFEEQKAKALLTILLEKGEIIEKRKNLFQLVS
jgi:TusA-related sulfurtransferase